MNRTPSNITFLFVCLATALAFSNERMSAAVIPVSDSTSLQQAINSAAEGSIIELAAGTYAAPSGGFTLFNPTEGFTVRAATGAVVTLNGAGATDIFRFTNAQRPITF